MIANSNFLHLFLTLCQFGTILEFNYFYNYASVAKTINMSIHHPLTIYTSTWILSRTLYTFQFLLFPDLLSSPFQRW